MSSAPTQGRETVLVIGATGNIGISAIYGALRSGCNVLAAVRNQESAKKIFEHVDRDHDRITTVEADVVSEDGVQGIVDQVRSGALPAFQHVYTTVGGAYPTGNLLDISTQTLQDFMKTQFQSNFLAYRATVPYLLEQTGQKTTFTLCTGAQGNMGTRPLPAMTQGALFSMCTVACRELAETNVRFNEVYLIGRVEVDADAEKHNVTKASVFARIYEKILASPDVKSCRIRVDPEGDMDNLKCERKGIA